MKARRIDTRHSRTATAARPPRWWILLALPAAVAFALLASPRLEAQGPYYDELFQVPSAFLLVGRPPHMFAPLIWQNVPLLTMPYVGATKSILYGLWMRWFGQPFDLRSWRFLAIATVALGLIAFHWGAHRGISASGLLLFDLLFLSDVTVLLYSRHDFGPVALALAFRLAWLGLWIKLETEPELRPLSLGLFGAIPAFLIYEKLNNAVLLAPLALAVFSSVRLRSGRALPTIAFGALLGLLPLLFVNLASGGISLRVALFPDPGVDLGAPWSERLAQLASLPGLGVGGRARNFILDHPVPRWIEAVELGGMVALLATAIVLGLRRWTTDRWSRVMALSAVAYLLTGALTTMLPRTTSAHHWVVATPFQYLALALLVPRLSTSPSRGARRSWPLPLGVGGLVSVGLVLLLVRGFNLCEAERDLWHGVASRAWDPSYAAMARFAAAQRDEASFVLADWGLGTAIYAFSNGAFQVQEPFWNYRGPAHLRAILSRRPGAPFYVLWRRDETPVVPTATASILRDAEALAGGVRLPVEQPLRDLRSVGVLRFPYPIPAGSSR